MRHDQMGITIMLSPIFVVLVTQHALDEKDQTQINVVNVIALSNIFMQVITHDSLPDASKVFI